ncbi:hypothetical protein H920_06286 [Fukomys damarensis]|uniref:Uncharacterized protein n=1 Tax=Fukomys damarensis TaxID=885580 RepID=A0A091DJN9_FUKDA|nr:hypothetical protein H920_06286 [Fukomys damarensis]
MGDFQGRPDLPIHPRNSVWLCVLNNFKLGVIDFDQWNVLLAGKKSSYKEDLVHVPILPPVDLECHVSLSPTGHLVPISHSHKRHELLDFSRTGTEGLCAPESDLPTQSPPPPVEGLGHMAKAPSSCDGNCSRDKKKLVLVKGRADTWRLLSREEEQQLILWKEDGAGGRQREEHA